MGKNAKLLFKQMLLSYGYPEKVVEALWKWYDSSEKKRHRKLLTTSAFWR